MAKLNSTTQPNKPQSPQLALFDFDGTISTHNSFLEFVAFTHGRFRLMFGLAMFIPTAILWQLRIISSDEFKRRFFAKFYAGMPADLFHEQATRYGRDMLPRLIRTGATEAIRQHKANGDTVIVVSASFQEVLKPWCDIFDIVCIGTVMNVEDGIVTGQLDTPVCWGPRKAERISAALDLSAFTHITAYGNSRGDREMLALATEAHYKPFR